jgi:hypothetical protein
MRARRDFVHEPEPLEGCMRLLSDLVKPTNASVAEPGNILRRAVAHERDFVDREVASPILRRHAPIAAHSHSHARVRRAGRQALPGRRFPFR